MKKLFEQYEEISGRVCLIRFKKFSELKFSKVNSKKVNKLILEFEKKIIENELFVKKDYYNFRLYCLQIESK